jgi:hypothetical protein
MTPPRPIAAGARSNARPAHQRRAAATTGVVLERSEGCLPLQRKRLPRFPRSCWFFRPSGFLLVPAACRRSAGSFTPKGPLLLLYLDPAGLQQALCLRRGSPTSAAAVQQWAKRIAQPCSSRLEAGQRRGPPGPMQRCGRSSRARPRGPVVEVGGRSEGLPRGFFDSMIAPLAPATLIYCRGTPSP